MTMKQIEFTEDDLKVIKVALRRYYEDAVTRADATFIRGEYIRSEKYGALADAINNAYHKITD